MHGFPPHARAICNHVPARILNRQGLDLIRLWLGTTSSQAHESPIGCTGSALGINLFTSTRNVHVGDTILYSVTVFR